MKKVSVPNCGSNLKTVRMQGSALIPRAILRAGLACLALGLSNLATAQAGSLDVTFASNGLFIMSPTGGLPVAAAAVALQSDGRIVVAGTLNNRAGLLRLTSAGVPDSTFGTNGIVNITVPKVSGGPEAFGVAIQADGKIVTAISTAFADAAPAFTLARLNTDGSLDPTFGNGGITTSTPFNFAGATAFTLQPDGKMLLAGNSAIARYDTNGQLDTTFGSGGLAVVASQTVTAIAVETNGQILLASSQLGNTIGIPGFSPLFTGGSDDASTISRYNSKGSLDNSFGISGKIASVAVVSSMLVQSDGKFVVAGTLTGQLAPPRSGPDTGFGILRYNADGSLDTTFGKRGAVFTSFGKTAPLATPYALALQSNGDFVAAGAAGAFNNLGQTQSENFGLARYTNTGTLDAGFGSGGTVTTVVDNSASAISALAVQSDGKIVAVGNFDTFAATLVNNFVVARYLGQ